MSQPLSPAAEVVAVATHKGGVGKTTICLGLAAALARIGGRVLLVDLDPQGHATVGLSVEFDPSLTVRELLAEEPAPVRDVEYATGVAGLAVVPATIQLEREQRRMQDRHFREHILQRALAPARARYDWIVVDCPPSLGLLPENAIVAATRLLVPIRAEARGVDGLVDQLELQLHLNPTIPVHLLRNHRHGGRRVANELLESDLTDYRSRVLETVIPQCEDLNHAQVRGQDIFTHAPRSTGAEAFTALAGEMERIAIWRAAVPSAS